MAQYDLMVEACKEACTELAEWCSELHENSPYCASEVKDSLADYARFAVDQFALPDQLALTSRKMHDCRQSIIALNNARDTLIGMRSSEYIDDDSFNDGILRVAMAMSTVNRYLLRLMTQEV